MEEAATNLSGLRARSTEGHAARAMNGGDVWVEIQEKTFTNWVNEQLRPVGLSVTDLRTDFCDGLKLVALMEQLQKRKLKTIRKPINQHQYLENVQTALNAMAADNIKLVNIGNTDIVEGNLKLILGLVWSLILRYQIGRTNFPPKKLMLAWLQAALPDLKITNFTSDWNSGIALSALLEYCQPGLFPHWKVLKPSNRVENCAAAMSIARAEFNVPMILTPEDLASPNLDELSGMTYLSYFMKEDSPGYRATLQWVQKLLPHLNIRNFTRDWNDGIALCSLVHSFGGNVPGYPNLSTERSQWEQNVQKGISGALSLGVEPLLKAKQLADPDVEHLGVMAYVARFQWAKPKRHPKDKISITGTDLNSVHVNKPAHFKINILDSSVDLKQIRAEVKSPSGSLEVRLNLTKTSGSGTFVPLETGMHELIVYCEGEIISSCPLNIRVHPDISKIFFSGIDPCALGSIVEVLINSNGAGGGSVQVEARSPTGKVKLCPVKEKNGSYTATFTPNEIGEWKILVTYSGEHIQGSPFTCYVYDPGQVKVQEIGRALVGKPVTFTCDSSSAGWGDVKIDVKNGVHSVPIHVDERGNGIYQVTFTPGFAGNYLIQVHFNNVEIKGSPFPLKVVETERELLFENDFPRTSTGFKGFHASTEFLNKSEMSMHKGNSTENLSPFRRPKDLSSWSMNSLDRAGRSPSATLWDEIKSCTLEKKLASKMKSPSPAPPSSTTSSSTVAQEELTFHQRAELVNSKLMARSEANTRSNPSSTPLSKKNSPAEGGRSWQSTEVAKSSSQFESSASRREVSKSKEDLRQPLRESLEAKLKSRHATMMTSEYPDPLNSPGTSKEGSSFLKEEIRVTSASSSDSKKDSSIIISGDGLKLIPVKQPATFTIRSSDLKLDEIAVIVTAPSGREVPIRIDRLLPGLFQVEYITAEVGEHVIDVLVDRVPHLDSPFYCSAYDASQIHVGTIPNGIVGSPVEFEINGADAGSGNLEILVNGGHVTSNVKSLGNQRFLASFIPHSATTHTIEMRFNGQEVPGSPWKCDIVDVNKKIQVKGPGLSSASVGRPATFEVIASGLQREQLSVFISGPSKATVKPKITEIQKDHFLVEYVVHEVGIYNINVNVKGQAVPGNPFVAKAYDASRIHIYDAPSSITLNKQCQFQVNASQAGEGQLEISVNEGQVPNQVQVLGNGKCLVSFVPETPTPHVVDIKFNGENIPGCPIVLDVLAESQGVHVDLGNLDLLPMNQPVRFTVAGAQRNGNLNVVVTGPSGHHLPTKTWYLQDVGHAVEFLPKEIGAHFIDIEYNGSPLPGSPFTFKTYNSQNIVVSPMPQGTLGKAFQFTVDASHAGEGNLEITVSSRGRNISTQVLPLASAKFGVSFVPTEQYDHIINISFNKEPVPGSPFKVQIGGSGRLVVSGSALVSTPVSKLASFQIQNGLKSDVAVTIEGPDGVVVPAHIHETKDGLKVEFSPFKTGEHRIHVTYKDEAIPGSPFVTKVYDIKQIKVKDIPIGVVGTPVTFIVETAHAGPGNLEVMVNNGQVPTIPQAQSPTQYAITFTPKQLKTHYIELKFNGDHIPGSPFQCQVLDVSKVWAKGEGLERVPVNRPSAFHVDTHGISLGDLQVTVIGPNRQPIKTYINGNPNSGYRVEYTPLDVGDHTVEIRINGQLVADSPYLVKAYDATRVKVSDVTTGTVGKPVFFGIDASQAGAGNLEIIVSVAGRNVPNYVQSEGNAKFRVNFKPTEAQTHTISVKFNGEPVPGSPFYVKVMSSGHSAGSTSSSSSLRMTSISKGARISIDTKEVDPTDCKVIVTGPSGKKLSASLNPTAPSMFDIQFSPQEVGPHQVLITSANGAPIAGSPIMCNVYDVTKVKVSKIGQATVGVPCTFQVDASQAGEGTLELVVTTKKSSLRAEVTMRSRGLYDVTFVPTEKMSHYVNITFNEEDVAGSPFKIEVKDPPAKASGGGEVVKHGLVGSVNTLEVEATGLEGELEARVTGPYGTVVASNVAKTERGTYTIEYHSREIGLYKVDLLHQGNSITAKPFLVEVCDPSRVKLLDVEDGIINREQSFKVDASRAGRGNLAVAISSGGREVRHSLRELGHGIYQVTYTPRLDLPHKIDVYYNGHQAPGCPQIVDIRDPSHSIIAHGPGLKSASNGKTTTFMIETGGIGEAKDFDILITAPNGSPLPVKCYLQKDGSLLAEWTPQMTGSHKIEVLYNGKPVSTSPFTCQVFDASKVSIQKVKTTSFPVNERITFSLSRKEAGFAELDVTVTSPLGRHLPIEVKGTPDGEGEVIEFTPTVPGKYKIAITYGGHEVPGSPITFLAQDGGTPRVEGPGLLVAQCNVPATFKINGKQLWGRPDVRVDGPETEAEVTIEEDEPGLYTVTYEPQEVGVFDIQVLWNGREIPGSPFHPKVVNPQKVRVIGGWENLVDERNRISLTIGEEKRIPFDVGDAGPGKLKAEVRGPNGMMEAHLDQTGSHRYHLSFTPTEPGEYLVYMYFSDIPIPKSPFLAYAEEIGPVLDHTRVILRGHGLTTAKVGVESEFIVDGSEAGPGLPEVTLTGPKADIPVKLSSMGNNTYRAVYTPTVSGSYHLNVMWSERQVKGCPLKINVASSSDASKVMCSGEGLRSGTVGKEIKAFIDTRRAGPGELTAHCMGPHKVAYCELYDHRDGTFTLYLKPQEGGRHVLTIKYGGENVPGSPFAVRISGAPDASKVRVYGPGIEPGVLATYQSRFICDTRGAGAGQLTVRIRGPKGAFRVEMQRESQKDRTILCKYDPTEPGDYRIEVKWSGEHVPGSPFMVMIFDTQEELTHYLQGQYPSSDGPPPPLPPADYFGGPGGGGTLTYGTSYGQMSWRGSTAEL